MPSHTQTQTLTQRHPTPAITTLPSSSSPITKITTPLRPDGRGFPSLYPITAPLHQQYTWEQVATHNTIDSCWVYSYNTVYDITEWLDRHPGGRDILLMSAGRDVTDLMTSYHPFTDKPAAILAKYAIGQVSTTEFPQYQRDSGFYAEVRAEAARYFAENKLDDKDPTPGLMRLAGMAVVAALSFGALIAWGGSLPLAVRLVAAVVFGVCQALPLLHCMHDSSHMSIGHTPSHWYWIGRLTMDWFAGASITSWHHQHTLGHHVYTNVMGIDPDLPATKVGDIRRVCKQQGWSWQYGFQHIYLCILYGVLAIKFRIQDVTGTLLSKENGMIRVNDNMGLTESVGQVATKLFWFVWRFVLPLYYCKLNSITEFLVLSFIAELVTGYYLTFNFQVSHVSPPADFPSYENQPQFACEWAPSQLLTTVDYAHGSPIAAFLCGALNYQSVHHLFPCVSQYHYPALSGVVQKVAKKWGVRYNYVGTFWQAVKLHLQHLQEMGVEEVHKY